MKKLFLTILTFTALSYTCLSQDSLTESKNTKISADLGGEIVSTFIWRGIEINRGPNIQGWGEFRFAGFSFGLWGSANFSSTYIQSNTYLKYTVGRFSAILIDYYADTSNFFTFDKDNILHVGELGFTYTLSENVPLQFSANTFIYGSDYKADTVNTEQRNYSTYVELSYPFNIGKTNVRVILGGTTHESAFYNTKGAAITNIGVDLSKKIKITKDFGLPISCRISTNPRNERVFTVFAITF